MTAPESLVDLTRQLVAIPSVNPAGEPGTDQTGEGAIANFLADFLKLAGAEVELSDVLPGRPNVIARWPTVGKKPRLAFAPHTDTVGVGGMTVDPFGGEIRAGRIHGRGASDTKGPMAAQLWALWEMRDELARLSHEIIFLGLMDEEAGQTGAAAAANSGLADFVIVAEPTNMTVVHTHKGSLWLEITTHGIAAHSSRPELGRNAIYEMARVVQAIETQIAPALALRSDPVLGSPTISAGVIRGGQKTNVVPDFCRLEVDIRTIPGMDDFLPAFAREIEKAAPSATVSVGKEALAFHTGVDHPLIVKLGKLGCAPAGAPWFCDAAVFAAAGIPSIAIGPGSIQQAHTADEFIEIAELERGAAVFREFLVGLRT